MSFAFPLALLGLIGIPIVILIYILQSKYNEQIISSTSSGSSLTASSSAKIP